MTLTGFNPDMVSAAFVDNGNGTVTDTATGLMWRQASADTNGGGPDYMNWQSALAYCENLTFAGHSDWRLPNIQELRSIVDYSTYSPAIDTSAFPDTVSLNYWSSTTYAQYSDDAWRVTFSSGIDNYGHKSNGLYVRAVRGGQSSGVGPLGYLGTIAQTPMEGPPGTQFAQWGTGFTPNSTVTLHFKNHLDQPLATQQLPNEPDGSFSTTYHSPTDKPVGTHTWWAVDDTTGRQSAKLRYLITGASGSQTNLNIDPPPAYIPPADHEGTFGELFRFGRWSDNEDTFVIVHGWNTDDDRTRIPDWVLLMAGDIRNDDNSHAKGANVFYWNWQEKAKTSHWIDYTELTPTDYIQWQLGVPFDEVPASGENLAKALKVAIPSNYNGQIHLIGHSLGSGVVAYAAQYARDVDNNCHFGNDITHLTLLDSPWLFDRPAGSFLEDTQGDVFVDNYYSQLGKITGYKEADTNVYLLKGDRPINVSEGHAYSYKWYRSSVTNFTNQDILDDKSMPSDERPYGFIWWDQNAQSDVGPIYTQIDSNDNPHWWLAKVVSDASQNMVEVNYQTTEYNSDVVGNAGGINQETIQLLNEISQRAQKTITILESNTFNTVVDVSN